MRNRVRFIFIMILMSVASHLQAQSADEPLISINRANAPLRTFFSDIEQQTSYRFLYKERAVDADFLLTLKIKDKPLSYVLNLLFEQTRIKYTIKDQHIILTATDADGNLVDNDVVRIKGVVKDHNGQPLPGVNVFVKGTPVGTSTGLAGDYDLDVPKGKILTFKYLGFINQEYKISKQELLNITLLENLHALGDVLVVGYSTQRKADLTGAVASVKMASLSDMSVSGINSALQGRMSGVTVLQSSGAPGSGTSLRIRGLGTIGNNDPLYIIDGMPADNMNDVNPNDIESLDVLKDASSAAIYGSRAANGVVIIQTKKGAEGKKINIAFNTYQGVSTPNHKIALLDAQQRNMIHTEAYDNAVKYDGYVINPQSDPRTPYYSPDEAVTRTNWQDQVLDNTAYQGNYDLSLSGGSSFAKYSVMAGHLDQNGILKNSKYARTTLRINTEWTLAKGLTVAENFMLTHSSQNIVESKGQAYGALSSALQYDPSVSVYDANGAYSGSGPLGIDLDNPMALVNRSDNTNTRDRFFGNAYAQYVWKDFSLKTDFGYDWSDLNGKWFVCRIPEAGRSSDTNFLDQQHAVTTHWINTTTLKFEKTMSKNHLMVLGGTSYENFNQTLDAQRGSDFISEEKSQRYMSAATQVLNMTGGREDWALQSYFARLDYSFDGKYLFAANIRADGSSKFAPGNRWGYFPSVSAGWRLSDETFFRALRKYIDNFKIRASWGKLGNQNINSNYPTKNIIFNTTDNDGYYVVRGNGENTFVGRYAANMPNPDLRWEVSRQTDVGVDISLFNKIEINADYYDKKSSGVLVSVPMPSLAGVPDDYWENAADIRNRGVEINVAYNTKIRKTVDISVFGNVSRVRNEVLSLGDGSAFYPTDYRGQNITRVAAGYPIGHFFGYKTGGIFRSQSEVDSYVNANGQKIQPNAKVGDLKFLDINHDGKIDANDRTDIGDGFPDFSYSFGVDLKFKGFDFSMFWQGVAGNQIFNALKYEGMFVNGGYNNFAGILDRFDPVKNPGGNVPRVTVKDTNGNSQMSDFYVDNGDYLRLKTLTIGYTLPKKTTQHLLIQKLRFYVTVQNLLTFTKYKGFDPELGETYLDGGSGYQTLEMGVDRGQFPQPKTIIVGMNLNF